MEVAMEELCHSVQALEENLLILKNLYHEYFHVKYEVLDPWSVSDKI